MTWRERGITHGTSRSSGTHRLESSVGAVASTASRQKIDIRPVHHAPFLLRSRYLWGKDEPLRPLHVLHIEQQDHLARVFHIAHHVCDRDPRRPLRCLVSIEHRLPAVEIGDLVPYQQVRHTYTAFLVCHLPRVKSGNFCGALPSATLASLSAMGALQAAAS